MSEFVASPRGSRHNPERFSPFSGYERNREPFLRVMRKHRTALKDIDRSGVPRALYDAARFTEAREVLLGLGSEPVFERERLFLDGACLLRLGRHAEADVVYAGLAQGEPTAGVLANRAAARKA